MAAEREAHQRPRLAAIDVGTNTIRLVVAEVESGGTYRILDEERENVRLGEGVDRTGRLSAGAIERALAAIGKMKAIIDGFEVTGIRAIATSAVREAKNGRGFLRDVRRRHKVRIEVISSDDEARLAFRSASRHVNLEGRATAVVDIGGGSVEVVLAAGTVIDQLPPARCRSSDRASHPVGPTPFQALEAVDQRNRSGHQSEAGPPSVHG